MGIFVFISYATKDSSKFQISKFAKKLKKYSELNNVLFWEKDMDDDIIKYMNDNIGKCDIFIIFCSKNALNSDSIEIEWQAALKLRKKIIPIFITESDIPPLLSSKLGIQFNGNNISNTVFQTYHLILKKLKLSLNNINKHSHDDFLILNGVQILKSDAKILSGLENQLNLKFQFISELKWDSLEKNSFSIRNKRIIGISLYDSGLKSFPELICDLKTLEILILQNNLLTEIPESIKNLKFLKILNMEDNQIYKIPKTIGSLNHLKQLVLNNNNIENIPESIGKLISLEYLNLDMNKLDILPASVGNLLNLKGLNLGDNKLLGLPDTIGDLKSIESIDLNYNRLTKLPETMINLKSLKELYIRENKFLANPESNSHKILKSLKNQGVKIEKKLIFN